MPQTFIPNDPMPADAEDQRQREQQQRLAADLRALADDLPRDPARARRVVEAAYAECGRPYPPR